MYQNILISGGTGLLGTNWAISQEASSKIVLACHKREIVISNVISEVVDLNSVNEIKSIMKREAIDLVINTAGYTNVESCEKYPSEAKNVNTTIPENLAIASQELKIKLIHISTDHLFDGTSPFCSENKEPRPINIYAKTKYKGEKAILCNSEDALIIRTNFFGWGPLYRRSFSDFIIDNLRKKNTISLFTDVLFTPVSISNLIRTTHELILKNVSGIINIASDERISKYDFGLKLAKAFDLDCNLIRASAIEDRKDLIARPKDLSLSNTKARKILNRELGSIDLQIEDLLSEASNGLKEKMNSF